MSRWLKILITILLIALIAFGVYYVFFYDVKKSIETGEAGLPLLSTEQKAKINAMQQDFLRRAQIQIIEGDCELPEGISFESVYLQVNDFGMVKPKGYEYVNGKFINSDSEITLKLDNGGEAQYEEQLWQRLYDNNVATAIKETNENSIMFCYIIDSKKYVDYYQRENAQFLKISLLSGENNFETNVEGFNAIVNTIKLN